MRSSGSREHQVAVGAGEFGGLRAVSKLRRAPVEVTTHGRGALITGASTNSEQR